MEHPCPKCGAAVVDGTPYCGQCGSPQNDPATPPLPPGTPGEVPPPAEQVYPARHLTAKPAETPRKSFLRSSLVAATVGTLLIMGTGIFAAAATPAAQPFVFLLMIATGGFAVTFYTRRVHTGITAGRGFKLGLLTGFFGAAFLIAISMLGMLSSQSRAEFRKTIADSLNNAAQANSDPAAKDLAVKMTAAVDSPGGLFAFLMVLMGFVMVIYLILAGVGGAVGAAVFGSNAPESPQIPS